MRWLAIILTVQFALHVETSPALAQNDAANVVSEFLKSLLKGDKRKRGKKVVDAPEHDHAAAVPMARLVPNKVNAAKKEIETRQLRLDAHFATFASWVDQTCNLSDEQKVQLNAAIKESIAKSQEAYKKPKPKPANNRGRSNYLYDYSPIQFLNTRGAAWGVYQSTLNETLLKILNEEQQKKLQTARTERRKNLHSLFFNHILYKADKELFLSSKQKEQIKNLFPDQLPYLESGAYSFAPQTHYIPEKPIINIVMHPPVAFKKVQMTRLQDLRRSRNSYISFQTIDGVSGWHKKLNAEAETQQEKFHRILDIRIAYFATEFQLSSEDKHYLKLAGKGAIVKAIAKWKKSTIAQFKSWEGHIQRQPGQNFGLGVAGIQTSELDKHPLWVHAVEKVITKQSYDQHRQSSQNIVTGYAAAMLDQELWLSADQRTKIVALLQDSQLIDPSLRHNQFDLSLLGVTIHGKKRKEIEAILNETQLNTFVVLKKQFSKQNNYITIQTRHGQTYLQQIPN